MPPWAEHSQVHAAGQEGRKDALLAAGVEQGPRALPGEVGKLSSGKLTAKGNWPDPRAASVPCPALPSSLPVGMVFFALPGNMVSALVLS